MSWRPGIEGARDDEVPIGNFGQPERCRLHEQDVRRARAKRPGRGTNVFKSVLGRGVAGV